MVNRVDDLTRAATASPPSSGVRHSVFGADLLGELVAARHLGGARPEEVEVRVEPALTTRTAYVFCRAVADHLRAGVRRLAVNLEGVKSTDVVGLAALLQSARLAALLDVPLEVSPSSAVHQALLEAGLLDELALAGNSRELAYTPIPCSSLEEPTLFFASTARLGLRPPSFTELALFERWANEPLLDQMVGSELLYRCRHLGAYHPDFVARVLNDPTSLTLLVQPLGAPAPVGFVRLYNIHLAEQFAFLETAVADLRWIRKGCGVEASRLLVAFAMDAFDIRRVEAKVYAYNTLSINSLTRNGFQREGALRQARSYEGQRWDILVFAILEDEMLEQRRREGFPYMGLWSP